MSSTEQGKREGYTRLTFTFTPVADPELLGNFFFINFYNFCHYSTSISGHALWPIWCGRCRHVADIDIAYGRYGVLCGRSGRGRYGLWLISSFPINLTTIWSVVKRKKCTGRFSTFIMVLRYDTIQSNSLTWLKSWVWSRKEKQKHTRKLSYRKDDRAMRAI